MENINNLTEKEIEMLKDCLSNLNILKSRCHAVLVSNEEFRNSHNGIYLDKCLNSLSHSLELLTVNLY